jgi:hypothetical protein
MQTPSPLVWQRLNVWGFTVASATAAVVLCIVTLPLHIWMRHHWTPYGMMHGGGAYTSPGYPMMHHAGFGLMHVVVALVMVAVFAGIGGAVVAAVYNAMLRERR